MKTKIKYLTPREIKPIVKSICDEFLVTLDELHHESNIDIKEARAIICYYLHGLNGYSSSSLARYLGIKHSTVIYHSKRITGQIEVNKLYAEKLNRIINKLK